MLYAQTILDRYTPEKEVCKTAVYKIHLVIFLILILEEFEVTLCEASGARVMSIFTVALEHMVTPISHLVGWQKWMLAPSSSPDINSHRQVLFHSAGEFGLNLHSGGGVSSEGKRQSPKGTCLPMDSAAAGDTRDEDQKVVTKGHWI